MLTLATARSLKLTLTKNIHSPQLIVKGNMVRTIFPFSFQYLPDKTNFMKKILLLLSSLFILFVSAQSQIKKGSHFLGGSLGVTTEKTTQDSGPDLKSNIFFISPAYGRAIKDNLIVGGDLLFQTYESEGTLQRDDRNYYGAGVFARKYQDLGKRFALFAQGRLGGMYERFESKNDMFPQNTFERKGVTVRAAVYPGISYAVTNKFYLETGFNDLIYLQYSNSKTDYATGVDTKTNRFDVGSSLSNFGGFIVGFRFIVGS
jgi:hypothetical protein